MPVVDAVKSLKLEVILSLWFQLCLSVCISRNGMMISMDISRRGLPSWAGGCRAVSGCLKVACILACIEATALVPASPCISPPFTAAMFVVLETVAVTVDVLIFEALTVKVDTCFSAWVMNGCLSVSPQPSDFLHTSHFTLQTQRFTLTPHATLPTPHSKVYNGVVTEERAQYCWNMLQLVVFQGCDVHLGSRVRSSFSVISWFSSLCFPLFSHVFFEFLHFQHDPSAVSFLPLAESWMEHPSLGILEAPIRPTPTSRKDFCAIHEPAVSRSLSRRRVAPGHIFGYDFMSKMLRKLGRWWLAGSSQWWKMENTEFIRVCTPNTRWESNMAGWEIHHNWI